MKNLTRKTQMMILGGVVALLLVVAVGTKVANELAVVNAWGCNPSEVAVVNAWW